VADILIVLHKLSDMDNKQKGQEKNTNDQGSPRPDAGTRNTTDPQKNMEGPVSSLMHETGESFESGESRKEADDEKDEKM